MLRNMHAYAITTIKQTMIERGREVGNPLVPLLLVGSSSHNDNALCGIK